MKRFNAAQFPFSSICLLTCHKAYNKWHETELEQWLSDHNIPYPTPADRKDLYDRVQKNWDNYAVKPYNSWDTNQLASYLKLKGIETKNTAEEDKNKLVAQVQTVWTETEDKAQNAFVDVKDWILDSWTDSQLKSFCDHHGIPGTSPVASINCFVLYSALISDTVPQPRERDVILKNARQNLEAIAKKSHQTFGYPGNWLYDTWTGIAHSFCFMFLCDSSRLLTSSQNRI